MKKIIIDTDIGVDIDDTIALAMACFSNTDIRAVTTVSGDVVKKARIARRVADMCGGDFPIVPGISKPLNGIVMRSTGLEDKMLPECPDVKFDGYAPDVISSIVRENRNGISLICLGPLTNIAAALESDPELKGYVKEIYFMGGTSVRKKPSYNIRSDIAAADIVFKSGIPLTLVSTEASKKAYWTPDEQEEMQEWNRPLTDFIYRQGKNYLEFSKKENMYLYDPLTLTTAITEEFVNLDNVSVELEYVEPAGKTYLKKDESSNIRFVYDVDAVAFKEYVRDVLQDL